MLYDALVFSRLRERPFRALLSIAAIAIGVAIALAAMLATATARDSFRETSRALDPHVNLQISGLGAVLDERVVARVRYVPGVARAFPVIESSALATGERGARAAIEIRGVDVLEPLPGVGGFRQALPEPFEATGSPVAPAALIGRPAAVLTAGLAAALHARPGDALRLAVDGRAKRLEVAAVLPRSAVGVDASVAFVDLSSAQVLFERRGTIDRIDCVVTGDVTAVRARIAAALPASARVAEPDDASSDAARYFAAFGAQLAVLGAIVFLIGATLLYDGIGVAIAARNAEIGILRTLGATRGAIFRTFVGEGLCYGIAGSLLGLALGEAGATFLVARIALRGASGVPPAVRFDGTLDAFVFVAGVAIAAAGAALASSAAVRVRPRVAMASRGIDAGAALGRTHVAVCASLVLCALVAASLAVRFGDGIVAGIVTAIAATVAGALVAPFAIRALGSPRLAARSRFGTSVAFALATFRALPRRLAVAIGIVALSTSAVAGFVIAGDSFGETLRQWARETFASDLVVSARFAGIPFSEGVRRSVLRVEGVARATGTRTVRSAYRGAALAVRGDDAFAPPAPGPTPAPGAAQPAAVSATLARRLGIGTGDVIPLASPTGTVRVRIVDVRRFDPTPAGAVTVARGIVAGRFRDARLDAVAIDVRPGANLDAVRERIRPALRNMPIAVATSRERRARALDLVASATSLVDAIAAACVLLSVLGVAATASALVDERRRSFELLRYAGATQGFVRGLVVTETAMWCALGAGIGALGGVLVALAQLHFIDDGVLGASVSVRYPVAPLLASGVATIVAAVACSLVPAARAARLLSVRPLRRS